jgi:hypothetical protein
MIKRFFYIILFVFSFYFLTIGCEKEYSYEGGPQDSIAVPDVDSVPGPADSDGSFPICTACLTADTVSVPKWSLEIDSSLQCGAVTNTVVSPDETAMTFFGPSTCWKDEGLIITAHFGDQFLNANRESFTSNQASLVYYDNTNGPDKLQSLAPADITVIIDHYTKQTGIATGRLIGIAADVNGKSFEINGTFTIRF